MKEKRRFDALTALKGLFILVIAFHNSQLVKPLAVDVPGAAFLALYGGVFGNSVFFILSGFLIAYNYRERIASRELTVEDFLARRLRKLYPLYLISNGVALLVDIWMYGPSAVELKKVVFTLLLQQGSALESGNPYNGPPWFLCTLVVCYVVYYAAVRGTKTTQRYRWGILLGIAWGYTLYKANLSVPFCYRGTGIGLMNFFIGCALAELYPALERKPRRWLWPVCLVVLCASLGLCFGFGVEIICGDVQAAASFLLCPLVVYLAFAEGPCERILRWKPFVYLGKISASIFFWHLVLYKAYCHTMELVSPEMDMGGVQYLGYVVLLLACSEISSRLMSRGTKQAAAKAGTQ